MITAETPCEVCRGTGQVYLEQPDGTPSTQVPCGYCGGRGNTAWWFEKRDKRREAVRQAKWLIVCYWCLLVVTNGLRFWSLSHGSGGGLAIHVVAWLLGFAAGAWWYVHPAPRKTGQDGKPRPPKHAPGFTDQREEWMATAVMAGALVKTEWERNHRHHAAPPPPPPAAGQQTPYVSPMDQSLAQAQQAHQRYLDRRLANQNPPPNRHGWHERR